MKRFPELIFALALVFLLSSCATMQRPKKSAEEQGPTEAEKIQKKLTVITKVLADINIQVEDMERKIETLQGKIEESSYYSSGAIKELRHLDALKKLKNLDKLKQISSDISILNSLMVEVDTQNRQKAEALHDQIEEATAQISMQINDLSRRLKPETAPPAKVQRRRILPIPSSLSAENLYQSANAWLLRGNYAQAEAEFSEYVKRYPITDLSDNSLYWKAVSITRQNRPADAVKTFMELVRSYPRSNKAPIALWRVAEIQIKIGEMDEAVFTLENLRGAYPDSVEATQVEQKLQEIQALQERLELRETQ